MTIRADISRNYLLRLGLGLVGLFCFGGGLYFFYDGFIGYPAWREHGLDFEKFVEENSEMDELDRLNKWKERAAERGWPQENPLDPDTGKALAPVKINEQFFYGGAGCLIGLGFLSGLAYMLGRRIECNATSCRDSHTNCSRHRFTGVF